MTRLIDADALECDTEWSEYADDYISYSKTEINCAPTIDAVPQWIPCEGRLPEEYGLYLATMNDGSVQECSYVPTDYGDVLLNGWSTCEASGFKVLNETDVLAWMPLPEPYEGERENK